MSDLYHAPIVYLRTHTWPSGLSDEDAFEKISERAKQNDPLFMVLLSMYLSAGKGCDENMDQAQAWLYKGLAYEKADAHCLAGMAYLYGYYGSKNTNEALKAFDSAEKICQKKGLYCKGYLYLNKYLADRSDKESFRKAGFFLRKSAMRGHATSLVMYIYCASDNVFIRYTKLISALLAYTIRRSSHSGPQRWWCYRDLNRLRPASVKFAEKTGNSLGYFSKK
ncbi:hypothetical protein [Vreelandella stevensii]|uniref:hypothetical protein n=1 Tax=Vreelandella stevensii TaxID=502821 RepID=UPI0037485A13